MAHSDQLDTDQAFQMKVQADRSYYLHLDEKSQAPDTFSITEPLILSDS